MKKILIFITSFLFAFSNANAIGINVGISGQVGVFEASATETEDTNDRASKDAMAAFGYGSIFLEKTLGQYLTVGIDYVPSALESETTEKTRSDLLGSTDGAASNVSQKVQVDFEDLTTYYVNLNLNENFYLKAGIAKVDIITNETLGTGSTYGNADLDGTVLGAGYNKNFGNGLFVRAEGTYQEFDGVTINGSGDTSVTADEINGVSAKLSIGKSF
jgi:hypothetical protein